MGYFLKKTKNKRGVYLQIYESSYDPACKQTTHRSVRPAGYVHELEVGGIDNSVAHFRREVDAMNERILENEGRAGPRDTASTYFDCTNFYFEIDREDGLRRKEPPKGHRPEPILGLGLLLDAECIPIGMTVFPGNEFEQPKIRELIAVAKARGGISGRTVRVADKGLNSADNVADALLCGGGWATSPAAAK